MVASRSRPKGVRYYGPFGLSVLAISLVPRQIGYQDLVAFMAQQPEVSQRARARMLASPFGTIHTATFSLPQPVGTAIPAPPDHRLASVDPRDIDITGAVPRGFPDQRSPLYRPRLDFPIVNRRLKGDLLVSRPREEPWLDDGSRDLTPGRVKTVTFTRPPDQPRLDEPPPPTDTPAPPSAPELNAEQALAPPPPQIEMQASTPTEAEVVTAALTPSIARETEIVRSDAAAEASVVTAALTPSAVARAPAPPKFDRTSEDKPATYSVASLPPATLPGTAEPLLDPADETDTAVRLGRLYFGNNPLGEAVGAIQPWPADEELLIQSPPANDPDFKTAALTPSAGPHDPSSHPDAPSAGETVAPKGEVTGPGKRPRTPAERLRLDQKQRAKAEKCLAEAVYFESRGEPKRGQIAVAQVVMNRVFSGFYPTNVCGAVYQNAHRKLACQFTFACDNVPDVVTEPDMWAQAKEIARDMLDGKLWLPEVGHSTHYHAYWVHPSWVNEMRRMDKIGVHKFYRPRAWGDGTENPPLNQSQAPQAGEAANKAKL